MAQSEEMAFLRPSGVGATPIPTHETTFADEASGRLASVAILMTVIAVLALLFNILLPHLALYDQLGQAAFGRAPLIVQALLSAFVATLAWKRRIPDQFVIAVAVAYQVIICWEASFGGTVFSLKMTQTVPMVTFCEILIVFFPLILPTRPRYILLAALLSAATRAPAALIASHAIDVPLDRAWFLATILPPFFAVLMALAGAKVVYGLRRRADAAKDVGPYRLEKKLGEGGMGEVWRARHRLLARPAAIKFIRKTRSGQPVAADALKRFSREAQATAQLKSPHTVELYDYGRSTDGSFYYVMELLDGITLQQLVERFGAVEPERAIRLVEHCCHSLEEAHSAGLVHRDIKPSNLVACRFGLDLDFVKVVDFGLVTESSERSENVNLTGNDQTIGTPAFISPEAARGDKVDHRADIYGLGCVFYWLLSGRLVFEADGAMAMAVAHAAEEPAPLSTLCEWDLPEGFEELVLDCLAKDPNMRPQSAGELAQRLGDIKLETPWTTERAESWWRRHRPLETLTPTPTPGTEETTAKV